jgi:hypothetical protein
MAYNEEQEFALWDKYEVVAMHFNDLIMRLRTQALTALAGVVTVAGLALNLSGKPSSQIDWQVLFATFVFLALAWLALGILDMFYYNRLLLGAVQAIHDHEDATLSAITTRAATAAEAQAKAGGGDAAAIKAAGAAAAKAAEESAPKSTYIRLSRCISAGAKCPQVVVAIFYLIVLGALSAAAVYAGTNALNATTTPSQKSETLELKLDRSAQDEFRLNLGVAHEPAKPGTQPTAPKPDQKASDSKRSPTTAPNNSKSSTTSAQPKP